MWGASTTEANRGQRMVDGQGLALEVVEAGGRHLAGPQGGHQGVGVVEGGPGRVEEDHPVAHGGELLGADHARSSPG